MTRLTWKESNDNTCEGKRIFYTWKQAVTFNNSMTHNSFIRRKGKRLEKLHPYNCLKCGHIHLGHPGRKADKELPPIN